MNRRRQLAYTLIAIGILDFIAFAIVGGMLGGAAIHGKADGGHFYLGGHGGLVEVSQATFNYSQIHGYTVWVTLMLALGAGVLLVLERWRRSGRAPGAQ